MSNPFSYQGRIGRAEFAVTFILIAIVGFFLDTASGVPGQPFGASLALLLCAIGLITLACFAIMKRLRHIGMGNVNPGVIACGAFLPLISELYLMFREGAEPCPQPRAAEPEDRAINTNPFSARGCIGRAGFVLTTILLNALALLIVAAGIQLGSIAAPLLAAALDVIFLCFALMKRMRHVGMENISLGALSWGIPIPIVLWVYLAFKEGAEDGNAAAGMKG